MARKTTAERLAEKLHKDTGIKFDPASFRRCYNSIWMKRAGAFAWEMKASENFFSVGSIFPASELVKNKYCLERINNEIFPREIFKKLDKEIK